MTNNRRYQYYYHNQGYIMQAVIEQENVTCYLKPERQDDVLLDVHYREQPVLTMSKEEFAEMIKDEGWMRIYVYES